MKILKVNKSGSGFGPRGEAEMTVLLDIPVGTPEVCQYMTISFMNDHSKHSVELKQFMSKLGVTSHNNKIVEVKYLPRYQDMDEAAEGFKIYDGETFMKNLEMLYNALMTYEEPVLKGLEVRDILRKTFTNV